MIDILIIEDSERKLAQILQLIHTYEEIREDPDVCKNVIAAKEVLQVKQYDLVILDIQLPLHDGDMPRNDAGKKLLEEVHSRHIYRKPHCIVGLTEYPELMQDATHLFADNFWTIIVFDETNSFWAERLEKKIDYLLEIRKDATAAADYACDLGIITALISPEFESVMGLSSWSEDIIDGDSTKYYTTTFTSASKTLKVVAACAPQMGMTSAAVVTTKLISHFHPKYLAMVGITAGVRGKVELGDVVVADPSWDWGSGKLIGVKGSYLIEPDPLPERLDPYLKAMFQDISLDYDLLKEIWAEWQGTKPEEEPRLRIGPCASGSAVIVDSATVDNIREHSRKLIGIEMEAYGLMHASIHSLEPKPKAFSMKAVCDFADKKKDDTMQSFAAFASATLVKRIALKYF